MKPNFMFIKLDIIAVMFALIFLITPAWGVTPPATPTVMPTTEMIEYVINPDSKNTLSVISADEVELKAISPTGIRQLVDIQALPASQPSIVEVEITVGSLLKKKIIQIYPDSKVNFSPNAETVMQVSPFNSPLELFYGLQKSDLEPWEYQFRVLRCGNGNCTVVRAEFDSREVWLEEISEVAIEAISDIPNYTALPNGRRI